MAQEWHCTSVQYPRRAVCRPWSHKGLHRKVHGSEQTFWRIRRLWRRRHSAVAKVDRSVIGFETRI